MLLASIIPIYLKHFLDQRSNLRFASLIGVAMIAITGLDLLPTLGLTVLRHRPPTADMEWWDPCQIASWLDALIWVPHHVAALVACFGGYLFLWNAEQKAKLSTRISLLLFAAFGFSSAAGLSVYVTFTFTLFALAWTAFLIVRGKIRQAGLHCAAGCLAVLLSTGYIRDLLGAGVSGAGADSQFVAFTLRALPFQAVAAKLNLHGGFAYLCVWCLVALLVLSLEFGVYLLIAVVRATHDWRHRRALPEAEKALWFMAGSSFFVIMFLRSTVIMNNDLAYRGAMVLQFVLLLWAAAYLANRIAVDRELPVMRTSVQKLLNSSLIALIAVGGLSSVYQLSMLRAYTFLSEKYGWEEKLQMANGHDAFCIRTAYAGLDRTIPSNAIVQFNPESKLITQMLVYSRYQQVDAGGPNCFSEFGGSVEQCAAVRAGLQSIFDPDEVGDLSSHSVSNICRTLHVNVLIVDALDPVWKRSDSWVWQSTPIVQNEFVRALRCGDDF